MVSKLGNLTVVIHGIKMRLLHPDNIYTSLHLLSRIRFVGSIREPFTSPGIGWDSPSHQL
jgi:hypothetical protein